MPSYKVKNRDVELFYCLNSDPRDFATATEPSHLRSRPYNPELPTLILIHSSASTVLEWRRQFSDPRLSSHFNLFAVDCIFSGWSTVNPDEGLLSFEDSANFVLELLDEMQFPEYHLLGEAVHGSNIAARIAVNRPNLVKSLTLASPGYRLEAQEVADALDAIRKDLFINKLGNGGDDSGTLPQEPVSDICAYFIGALPRLANARSEMSDRFHKRFGVGQSLYEVNGGFNLVILRKEVPDEKLAALRCPVLILRGGEDNIVSPEKACDEWRRALLNAQVSTHTIASAPSLLSLSDANVVNRIVSNFCLRSK